MGFEDIAKKAQAKAQELINSEKGQELKKKAQDAGAKAQEAMKSEKAEAISDKVLGGVSDAAKKVTRGKYDEKIDKAREAVDKRLGNE